jgi:endonuclease YncB( thermonuclease family)
MVVISRRLERRHFILGCLQIGKTSAIVFLVCLACSFSQAADFIGVPRIVDGDTLAIGVTKIRLEGIDAPETDQVCLNSKGERWACGIEARNKLAEKTNGKNWTCHSGESDRYRRLLATCIVDGEDINGWMVREGWALAYIQYSRVYEKDEMHAREAQSGLWAGAFIAPWDWRHRSTKTVVLGAVSVPINAQSILLSAVSAESAPNPDCVIKANMSRSGECIYHTPGGLFYSRLKMDTSKGKRWFCTATEAEAAGCRKSLK